MIDGKIIERIINRAIDKSMESYPSDHPIRDLEGAFRTFALSCAKATAKFTQKEFINSLWHDASEKPKDDTTVLIIGKEGNVFTYLIDSGSNWNDDIGIWETVKWCYIDDLLPKEGGEE